MMTTARERMAMLVKTETFEGKLVEATVNSTFPPCDHASLLFLDGCWTLRRGDAKQNGRFSYIETVDAEILFARDYIARFDFDTHITVNGKKKDAYSVIRVQIGEDQKPGLLLAYKSGDKYFEVYKMDPRGVTIKQVSVADLLRHSPQAAEQEVML